MDPPRCWPKFLVTSGLWAQHGFTGNLVLVVCSNGSQMNVTVQVAEYEQKGQSMGLIHSTMQSVGLGWGLGWGLGRREPACQS